MKISIIIPVFNENGVIAECTNSLMKQDYGDFEIIVVDDGSTDNTKEILTQLQRKYKKIKVVWGNHKGPGAARNNGVKQSKGEILVFVDADMTFEKDFLSSLVDPIVNGKEKGTFSKEEYVLNWENIWAKCLNINEEWMTKRRHPLNYPNKQKVFRAILKSEFERVGGFTPGGYDDDWSLSKKLGYQATNAPNAIFYHRNPSTLGEVFNQAKWIGKRKYKFAILGAFIALIRASLPISLTVGFIKSVLHKTPAFVVFKIVYDFGIFCGILTLLFHGNLTK